MSRLTKAVRTIISAYLNLKPHESLLVVSETTLADVGEAIWKCAQKKCKQPLLLKYTNSPTHGHVLSSAMINCFSRSDCVVILTPTTITKADCQEALQNGTRIVLLSNTTSDIIERLADADHRQTARLSRRLADIFSIGRTLRLTSPTGSDLTIPLANLKGIPETGEVTKAGEFSFLPAGEACLLPGKRNTQGQIVIDRIAGASQPLSKPILMKVQKGQITQIKGNGEAERLRRELRKFGKNGKKISELGIGTNAALELGNSMQEDEKVCGTAHVTIGQNRLTKAQRKVIHSLKAMILEPTVTLDGKQIIDQGKIVV